MAQRVITGKVTDAGDSQGLPGATVQVKGTTRGTSTNSDGMYSLEVPNGATTLVFRFYGLRHEGDAYNRYYARCSNSLLMACCSPKMWWW